VIDRAVLVAVILWMAVVSVTLVKIAGQIDRLTDRVAKLEACE
jgi:hypothetical protein